MPGVWHLPGFFSKPIGFEMTAPVLQERTLILHDGRRVGLAEVGDPEGTPVFFCHGLPASRLEIRLPAAAAATWRVRLLGCDRPGYGRSDPVPRHNLSEWAEDVRQVVDQLGIDTFLVLGVSGGGPYALALAQALADRVRAAAVVCGLGPVWQPEARAAMHWPGRLAFGKLRWLPALVYGSVLGPLLRRRPETALRILTVGCGAADRRTLAQPEVRDLIRTTLREGLRQGPRGALADLDLFARDWGFALESVSRPVQLWHGAEDSTVPELHSRMIAARLPRATLKILPDEGHFSLPIGRAANILEVLQEAWTLP